MYEPQSLQNEEFIVYAVTQPVLNHAFYLEMKSKLKFILTWLFTYYHNMLLRPV